MRADADAVAVEDRLQRANSVLRVVVLADALALVAYRWESLTRPWLGVLTCALMVAWTAAAVWAYRGPRLRTPTLLVLDLAMALLAMSATPANASARSRCDHESSWTTARPVRLMTSVRSLSGSTSASTRAGSPFATIRELTVRPARESSSPAVTRATAPPRRPWNRRTGSGSGSANG